MAVQAARTTMVPTSDQIDAVHVETLLAKNRSLSEQLDKVTNDLFKAQEIATELKLKLEDSKHSEQLAGWAIDRAIETAKLFTNKPEVSDDIINLALQLCNGVKHISSVVNPQETMQ